MRFDWMNGKRGLDIGLVSVEFNNWNVRMTKSVQGQNIESVGWTRQTAQVVTQEKMIQDSLEKWTTSRIYTARCIECEWSTKLMQCTLIPWFLVRVWLKVHARPGTSKISESGGKVVWLFIGNEPHTKCILITEYWLTSLTEQRSSDCVFDANLEHYARLQHSITGVLILEPGQHWRSALSPWNNVLRRTLAILC
jgi:hypothetical protein